MVGIVLYETDALCISTCTVPWFWEEGHEEVMQTLRAFGEPALIFPDLCSERLRFLQFLFPLCFVRIDVLQTPCHFFRYLFS